MRRSASVLAAYSECAHLAWLDRRSALGLEPRPAAPDAAAELLFAHGREHERLHLESLRTDGIEIVTIEDSYRRPEAAAAATLEAMRAGVPVVYQGVLLDDGWWGIPDFLERVERPSELGAWSYEVVDAKLAKRSKPVFLLQLGLYSALLAAAQGAEPERLHVVLGTPGRTRESFRVADFAAYFRRLRARALVATSADVEPCYPAPVEFCAVCAWSARCEERRERDDHLSRVAGIRGSQIRRLAAAGVDTLAALAALPETVRVPRLAPATLTTLRRQARLQQAQRTTGTPSFEFLPTEPGRGFALLPPPSPGDVFFDMEGDPYVEGGLEYLFGATAADEDGVPRYRAWWGHDRAGERRAFEGFMDWVVARRAADPAMHVYHYAAYEPTALKRLAGRFGTRESELDDLLRGGVLVDLYRVVRQGLCISQPSYSIKKLEVFYAGKREGGVTDAGQSIVAYERWMDERDQAILDAIERYNEDDCDSTLELRDWLLARRGEAPPPLAAAAPPPAPAPEPAAPSKQAEAAKRRGEEARARGEEGSAMAARILAGLETAPPVDAGAADALRLLARLVEYHRREARPAWWAHFARMDMDGTELIEDPESIAGLEPDPAHPPRAEARSLVHTFRFPDQETKLSAGDVFDPVTGRSAGTLLEVELAARSLRLKRGPTHAATALPRALVPGKPIDDEVKREAVRRFARAVVAGGLDGAGPYRALRDLLRGSAPRVRGLARGTVLPVTGADGVVDEAAAARVVLALDESALFVQGPPGSGKTWLGARLIVRALQAGKRVGVVAHAHRAIHNLLHQVEAVADERGFTFRGVKKSSGGNEESVFVSRLAAPCIVDSETNEGTGGYPLVAGTAWLFAREEMDATLDLLFVDEAGQVALADAIASGTAARNVVFLGDPNQLAQVSQAVHPDGAGASVLVHMLGGHATVPPDRGIFLGTSWRMHPGVCEFVSESFYEGRLRAAPGRERQRIEAPGALSGAGVRFVAVEHAGNGQRAPEEAVRVAALVADLLSGGTWTATDGTTRALEPADVKVVTPYNAQAQELRAHLPAGVAVGTVDRFQGQEAPVVFYSMATSSGEDLPRNLEFLMSRYRLNVAVSRAQALAVLVASPRLLDVACRSVDELRLVNALCRFVERAAAGPPVSRRR